MCIVCTKVRIHLNGPPTIPLPRRPWTPTTLLAIWESSNSPSHGLALPTPVHGNRQARDEKGLRNHRPGNRWARGAFLEPGNRRPLPGTSEGRPEFVLDAISLFDFQATTTPSGKCPVHNTCTILCTNSYTVEGRPRGRTPNFPRFDGRG